MTFSISGFTIFGNILICAWNESRNPFKNREISLEISPSHARSAANVRSFTFLALIFVFERTLKLTGRGQSVTINNLSSSHLIMSVSEMVSNFDGQYLPFS